MIVFFVTLEWAVYIYIRSIPYCKLFLSATIIVNIVDIKTSLLALT